MGRCKRSTEVSGCVTYQTVQQSLDCEMIKNGYDLICFPHSPSPGSVIKPGMKANYSAFLT